jgi:hypothetical protein
LEILDWCSSFVSSSKYFYFVLHLVLLSCFKLLILLPW